MANITFQECKEREFALNAIGQGLGIEFEACEVYKPAGLHTGIRVKRTGANIAPVIYVDEDFLACDDSELVEKLLDRVESTEQGYGDELLNELVITQEYIYNNVIICLAPVTEKTLDWFRYNNIFADDTTVDENLKWYYRVLVGEQGSFVLTYDHIESMELDYRDLMNHALKNTVANVTIRTMREVLAGFLGEIPEEMIPDNDIYIVSNKQGIYGATLDHVIYKRIGKCYIIPSSIHECLAVPKNFNTDMSPEDIKEMVANVNDTQVSEAERLSYSVYEFDGTSVFKVA